VTVADRVPAPLAGLGVAVAGHPDGPAPELGRGLEALGARVAVLTAGLGSKADVARQLAPHGHLDAFVLADLDPALAEPAAFGELAPTGWTARCEVPLQRAMACLQAAHASLRGGGGAVVVLVPTFAMAGAPGRVAAATAAEGVRSMAKAAARQWGADAITVNAVAVGGEPWSGELPPPALGAPPEVAGGLAATVAMLIDPLGRAVTGSTIAADGGAWMGS
jgi:3-oxoacyl-[acyl-carrier protein] reductase